MEVAQIITEQARDITVMAAAGVLTESAWQLKNLLQTYIRSRGCSSDRAGRKVPEDISSRGVIRQLAVLISVEILFWICAFTILSLFLYYSSFGSITFHGIAAFLAGLLLWKKICCGIIAAWVETDAVQNSVTAAVSSTWKKRGKKDRKNVRQSVPEKQKRQNSAPELKQGARQLPEKGGTKTAP